MPRNNDLGRRGEDLAVNHLIGAGYEIVDRNWRSTMGEIDIIARTGNTSVFVEVKTRSGTGFGHPLAAVTPSKLARLRRLAGAWCAENGPVEALRVDVIGVIIDRDGTRIEHVEQVC